MGKVLLLDREHNIAIVCLFVNLTDKMQPLDVGLFSPVNATAESNSGLMLMGTPVATCSRNKVSEVKSKQLLPKAFERCGLAFSVESRVGPGADHQCDKDHRGSQASGQCAVEEGGSEEFCGFIQKEAQRGKKCLLERATWTARKSWMRRGG